MNFKKVPAIEKCFAILDLLSRNKEPMRLTEISKSLNYNQSTVYNLVYTLVEQGVLEKRGRNNFHFGPRLYVLGRAAMRNSELIRAVHPFLEKINRETRLMAILGIRSGLRTIILDKVNSDFEIQIVSEVGMRIPLLAGAGGKALLTLASDQKLDEILANGNLRRYTPYTCTDKAKYKAMIQETRTRGVAVDMEEYIEGVRALAAPLRLEDMGVEAAIWVVGLKDHIKDNRIESYSRLLKDAAGGIEHRLTMP